MERLTVKDAAGNWQIRDFTEILPAYWQACNRLAAYEDTGDALLSLTASVLGIGKDRLRELAQAERKEGADHA